MERILPDHPGILLKRDFLDDLDIKPGALARAIGVDRAAIKRITEGERDISAEMSIRLGEFFGMSHGFWFGIQNKYKMRVAEAEQLKSIQEQVTPMRGVKAA